ncbi:hypothetical protein ORI98_06020 [Shewanella sp. ULN5]|uniref:hypothetical protein n=1 Tax=Shewanella sp. ULN5 TaxID=2994678 RepID=UPI00273F6C75|nr:hypothetical protein [Shewanella sp. ULN5]MDP5145990.1 hypothetical protein [Shewanella sp. ULN5]
MTFDQKIQLANTIGTWLAAIGTISAVITSLYFARTSNRINLRVFAGLRVTFDGDGSPPNNYFGINITNKADRNVVITSIGWSVGKRKNTQFCIQPFHSNLSVQYPKTLQHGESASFLIPIDNENEWLVPFATGFVKTPDSKTLKSLKLWVETSVGERVILSPENNFINKLKEIGRT